jgi:hypothetical protein
MIDIKYECVNEILRIMLARGSNTNSPIYTCYDCKHRISKPLCNECKFEHLKEDKDE